MARYLYSELSTLVQARLNCAAIMNGHKSGDGDKNQEWFYRHEDTAEMLVKDHMPSGSGFDSGTKLDWDASHAEKLVFTTSFHHMNEGGYYSGWTEHTVTVTPSLANGFHLRVSGRDRNDIKEFIYDQFRNALMTNVEWDIVQTWPVNTERGVEIQTRWTGPSSYVVDVIEGTQRPKMLVETFEGHGMWDKAQARAVETVKGY